MISLKSALAYLLLLGTSLKVEAEFDVNECTTFVFRTSENILWHCGDRLPVEPHEWATANGNAHRLYCDHSFGDHANWPWAWGSAHPDEWCEFMIDAVRNGSGSPLTPDIGFEESPSPNPWFFTTMVDWGCYKVENGVTVDSYLIKDNNVQQCPRVTIFFDDNQLPEWFWSYRWSGNVPNRDHHPDRTAWGRCHYDDNYVSPNYTPELDVTHAECLPGYYCELLLQDYAFCMPDPKADHECCISWHMKCESEGDCCIGSECNSDGFCQVGLPQVFDDPPGICSHRTTKAKKGVWSRCYKFETEELIDDCADGYICEGDHMYAQCNIDPAAKHEWCKWEWDSSNPRPGDCCLGWKSFCHHHNDEGKCVASQCIPGEEEGIWKGVHNRLETDPPHVASWNEVVEECTGAVCGVWGDPHIVTCDDLRYDCQAVGLFTLMKNHMFNIQGHFVHIATPWGGASITNDIVIDYLLGDEVPKLQLSFPNFKNIDLNVPNPEYPEESKVIGNCPVMFYMDDQLVDISGVGSTGYLLGDANSDYSVKRTSSNEILITHAVIPEVGEKYYSQTVVWVEGTGPGTEWSCILTYFICLPGEEQERFKLSSVGLLGTPNGKTSDDWMGPSGQTLLIPDHGRGQASFDYCVENWCVGQDESIIKFEDGLSYEDYMCADEEYHEFDVNECGDADHVAEIIAACEGVEKKITCQMERCIGNPDVNDELKDVDLIKNGDDDEEDLVEDPETEAPDYGDCANLGSGLSGSTGNNAWAAPYPRINCIHSQGGFSLGYDHSASVLVGGSFTCKQGAGFEGRGVFLGDFTVETDGCERMAATARGSLIHPPEDTICIEVGGDVAIDATHTSSKYVMYEYGNANKACHFVYKNGCTMNSEACPHDQIELEDEFFFTNGDFKKESDLDLDRWADEIILLQQKATYWKSLEPNGSVIVDNNSMTLKGSSNNSPVQIFKMAPISEDINNLVFSKELHGKTILIIVDNEAGFQFEAPVMCYHPENATPSDAPICNRESFPAPLTSSIAWLFPHQDMAVVKGSHEFQGSIVAPWGSVTASMKGQSGRMIVGGDLIIDGEATELHNYEFDPHNHPLPLGEELNKFCEVEEPSCVENYKDLTSETVCPSRPGGVVNVIRSSHVLPEGEPILYDIIIEQPSDPTSAKTVKFKVDNPWTNHTDIFIKHVKKVGKYAMDPVCDSMPFTAGCSYEAPVIEIGCHEYEGVDAFALVNLYFASNTDSFVMDAGNEDVTIDKCCKPPENYDNGYGIIEVTLEVQCTCPDGSAEA